jgi:hypothetical protein
VCCCAAGPTTRSRRVAGELAGLTDQTGFVKSYFEGEDDAASKVALVAEVLARPAVEFLRSPLALQLVCTLYDGKETVTVPATLTELYTQVSEKLIRRGLHESKDEAARDRAAVVVDCSTPTVLTADEVRRWSVDHVCELFQNEFEADATEVATVLKERISGKALLDLTKEDLVELGLAMGVRKNATRWIDAIKKVVAISPPAKPAAQQAREVLEVLDDCEMQKEGVMNALRRLDGDQRRLLLSCGILKVVREATCSIEHSVEEWELHEWDWYHASFGDYFAARRLVRTGRQLNTENAEHLYLTLKPLSCVSRLGWQFAVGLLGPSDPPTLRAALWRLLFVGLYREEDPPLRVQGQGAVGLEALLLNAI